MIKIKVPVNHLKKEVNIYEETKLINLRFSDIKAISKSETDA